MSLNKGVGKGKLLAEWYSGCVPPADGANRSHRVAVSVPEIWLVVLTM